MERGNQWNGDKAMKFRRLFTTINHPQTKFMPNCLITTEIIGNLSCRIYKPLTIKEHSFNLIYYHGGGFCLFSPGDYDKLMVNCIEQFNCHIISLDYPFLGSFNYQSPSYQQFPHFEYKSILSPRLMAEFVLIYLGVPCNKQNTDAILQSDSIIPTFNHNSVYHFYIQST
uniref:Abhydrolase_3 domain-containing protein n=1 Tax=Rhabditophanes sp. KR3021 TaxID=114890 RepID=A0AC35THT9_9BILA